ncbi:hypothetical protein PW5551_08510 [Petrotoga sp. 9PW.55.5.1]|uniref:class I mannose-6-phosphate isomerase n=1 Tax=Petrotoga sp. 9PW.55.5.1 TaxID=1308979 RepID=UPI000DC5B472|nr:class I mannose-6-phosphate isomerase [Petrotoga sp. 9PW.55.5.1]RAO98641.1 hypothetical protein PW5551_08510 [Petrotoga sp. 9PW.55.5.1]
MILNKGEIIKQLNKPLLIKENRVRRLYKGGALIDRFRRHMVAKDDFLPEDWIGSTTLAINRDPIPEEGIGKLIIKDPKISSDMEISFKKILEIPEYAETLFGDGIERGKTPGILVKLLDSITRLPLQTHPNKKFTSKYFHDNHGKCESWIVLEGRKINNEDPYVLYGFKEHVTKELFIKAYNEQKIKLMESFMNKIYVKPGDIFYIEPNIIHAIGPGVFLLEIQEPTDYVFQFDKKGEYWELNDYEVHMGLGEEVMLNTIEYELKGSKLVNKNFSHIDIYKNYNDIIPLFKKEQNEYFGCDLITSEKSIQRVHKEIRIGVVIEGSLNLNLNGSILQVQKGDTYMLPAPSGTAFHICNYNNIKGKDYFSILEAFPI